MGETYLFVDAMEWQAHYRHEKRHEHFELVSLTRAERILREVAREEKRLLQQLFEDFTYSGLTRLEPRQQLERLLARLGYEPVLGERYPRAAKFYVLRKPFAEWPASGFSPLPAMPADTPFEPPARPIRAPSAATPRCTSSPWNPVRAPSTCPS